MDELDLGVGVATGALVAGFLTWVVYRVWVHWTDGDVEPPPATGEPPGAGHEEEILNPNPTRSWD